MLEELVSMLVEGVYREQTFCQQSILLEVAVVATLFVISLSGPSTNVGSR